VARFTLEELDGLGTPEIIEEVAFEQLLDERKQRIISLAPTYGLTYDVEQLETDPAMILAQSEAYRETLLRARGNDIARANYLYFTSGSALDHMAAFYDVTRMAGETDERLKRRVILAIQGRSTGGTAPRYRSLALEASIDVADAYVYTDGKTPIVYCAIFADNETGEASQGLIDTVQAYLDREEHRMISDAIIVRSAVVSVVDVSAALTLLPDTSADLVTQMQTALASDWAQIGGLGRDLTVDWLKGHLMRSGVHSVAITSPADDVVMQQFEAVRIGSVSLTVAGRAF